MVKDREREELGFGKRVERYMGDRIEGKGGETE